MEGKEERREGGQKEGRRREEGREGRYASRKGKRKVLEKPYHGEIKPYQDEMINTCKFSKKKSVLECLFARPCTVLDDFY